jgi:hypothetical protein
MSRADPAGTPACPAGFSRIAEMFTAPAEKILCLVTMEDIFRSSVLLPLPAAVILIVCV